MSESTAPFFIFPQPDVRAKLINDQLRAAYGEPTHTLIFGVADPIERDQMHETIASAVAVFNAHAHEPNQKGPTMSENQSAYILTSDVPAFLAEREPADS